MRALPGDSRFKRRVEVRVPYRTLVRPNIIHCELRDSKSPRQAEVRTIRAAIADLHPYKGKLAK